MRDIKNAFSLGFKYFFLHRTNLILAFVPIAIGLMLYFFAGAFLFHELKIWLKEIINFDILNTFLSTGIIVALSAIITIILYFVFNWTFLLFVFFISYPFHKKISSNIEVIMGVDQGAYEPFTFDQIFHEGLKVILNLIFILLIFTFTYLPLMAWLALILSCVLASIQFLDYVWSRHFKNFKQCIDDLFGNFFAYTMMGAISLFLCSLPIINLLLMPILVSVYTVYWHEKRKIA